MKRVELKRIAEALWKGNSPDEKTAFATQSTVPDNGSFSKNFEADDIKRTASKEFAEDEDEKSDGPMSIPRKICFVLSFNVWILYFLVMGWLVPCRNLECGVSYPSVLQTNFSSIWLLTNVETVNKERLPSLAVIGYGNGTEIKLAGLATYDAAMKWNRSVAFIPREVQCNFENPFDVDGDGITDCLLSGSFDLFAFNAKDGRVFWNQSIDSEEGNILTTFHPTSMLHNNVTYLIGAWGDKLVILDAHNGNVVTERKLPCDDTPFKITIISSLDNGNLSLWTVVCDFIDKVEAWSFGEQEVLKRNKSENNSNDFEFSLLFSGSNSDGSMALGCDVTTVPGGPLLISWSNRVAMVTLEATAWVHHFPQPLSVAAIKVGHFASSENFQVAAAVRNATDTIVYILDIKNGSAIDSITLPDRIVKSMKMVSHEYDVLVLESGYSNFTSPPLYNNMTDPIPTEQTNFVQIDFSGGTFKTKDIVTAAVVRRGSALGTQTNGQTDLLIFKTEDGMLSYERHVLHDTDTKESFLCLGATNGNHYSFET